MLAAQASGILPDSAAIIFSRRDFRGLLILMHPNKELPLSANYVLALDQGTSSSRALVIDPTGAVRGAAQQEFRQIYPRPGWVEHDAEEIWESQLTVAQQAIASAGASPEEISAIGLTNQRETVVLWDRNTGEPVCNAIVWQDRRTTEYMADLEQQGCLDLVRDRTGLLLDPYFSASKLRWMLDNVDGARDRAERGELAAGTVDAWLMWQLTGGRVHATDVTNASRTLLCDISTGQWDAELLELFGVPKAVLPEIVSSSGVIGECDASHFNASIPIAGVV